MVFIAFIAEWGEFLTHEIAQREKKSQEKECEGKRKAKKKEKGREVVKKAPGM